MRGPTDEGRRRWPAAHPSVRGKSLKRGLDRDRLEAIPAPKIDVPAHIRPSVGFGDDSIQRLKDALTDEHKREQARGAVQPTFLAIDCPFGGPDAEDFDQALFGHTVRHIGRDLRTVGFSFNSNGLLVRDKDIPFAGVLAFLGMRMTDARQSAAPTPGALRY